MNQRYIDYANYNVWSNTRLLNTLLKQEDNLIEKELVGSFSTIRATMLHLWFAETGWLSRLRGNGWKASNVTAFEDSNEVLFKSWQKTSEEFKNFVEMADLEKEVSFKHKGEVYSIPTREIVQTVFNHGSFHRGQIVMMMRQLGITDIPQTDYIEWVRMNAKTKSK